MSDDQERPKAVVLDPHRYTESAARARLERRRKRGEELVMREIDGWWYTGRAFSPEIIDLDPEEER